MFVCHNKATLLAQSFLKAIVEQEVRMLRRAGWLPLGRQVIAFHLGSFEPFKVCLIRHWLKRAWELLVGFLLPCTKGPV